MVGCAEQGRKARRLAFGQLTFQATLANTNVSQTTINSAGLSGYGISEIEATDTAGGTYDEVQTVELDNASCGTFRLAFNGETTAALDHDAISGEVIGR